MGLLPTQHNTLESWICSDYIREARIVKKPSNLITLLNNSIDFCSRQLKAVLPYRMEQSEMIGFEAQMLKFYKTGLETTKVSRKQCYVFISMTILGLLQNTMRLGIFYRHILVHVLHKMESSILTVLLL